MKPKSCFSLIILSVVAFLLTSCVPGQQITGTPEAQAGTPTETQAPANGETPAPPDQTEQAPPQLPPQPPETVQPAWQLGGLAIAGSYADAEIVALGNGNYRMYYAIEPEVPGNKLEVFSATSTDGITWSKEAGTRKEFATFPDAVKLPNGKFRLYFQNAAVIKSATSDDGLSWRDENGIRINTGKEGELDITNVRAPTTLMLDDGTYLMVYSGAMDQKYAPDVPNSITTLLFYAISTDGINFEKKGIALDSRNSEFKGWLDGPELVKWDDNEIRLYFWSYRGIYHITYNNGMFSPAAVFDYTTNENPLNQFPESPPGDPTLAKINGKWLMYYGQHTKGIYYAELRNE